MSAPADVEAPLTRTKLPMLTRSSKSTFFRVAGPFMRLNGWIYRRFRTRNTGVLRVHLGPGQENYLHGWVNVDANMFTAKVDLWANLLDPLPFADESVDCFYSHHVVEHLPDSALPRHFSELARCLKPAGVLRIGGPHAENAARKLLENDTQWFGDWPDRRRSVGGRYANFILCRGEHLTLLTPSYLSELLSDAGLSYLGERMPGRDTDFPELFDPPVLACEREDCPQVPHTLIVEARKNPTPDRPR